MAKKSDEKNPIEIVASKKLKFAILIINIIVVKTHYIPDVNDRDTFLQKYDKVYI